MGKLTDVLLSYVLDSYRFPLNRMQVFALRSLNIPDFPGFEMRTRKKGTRVIENPKVMYAFYNNELIGIAYGTEFRSRFAKAESPEIGKLIDCIERAYLRYDKSFSRQPVEYPNY
jgi:hypothetical protein